MCIVEEVVQVISDELFQGFEEFDEELEEALAEVTAMFYRYMLYGKTINVMNG